jgi:hypothetical protein
MLIFLGLLLFGLHALLYQKTVYNAKFGSRIPSEIVGIIIISVSLFVIWIFSRYCIYITAEEKAITVVQLFGRTRFGPHDIKHIDMTGRRSMGFFSRQAQMSCMIFYLESGKEIVVFDILYYKLFKLKSFIKSNTLFKVDDHLDIDCAFLEKDETFYPDIETFSGNPFTSLNGIILIFLFVITFFLFLIYSPPNSEWAFFYVNTIYLAFIGWQMHYFQLSMNELIIRNHIWFWRRKKIATNDIAECIVESYPKKSDSLRIVLKSYQTYSFSAGSLRNSNWIQLCKKLNSLGVVVKKETL